ncbi:MAG: enoyl-CoA hydratase/isomerase family protein, partial [Deltaproteobacteria bacterium]|nr:enoyl-CoA hydratase/isomerase family protein [Deltaproteobacteria bacterium]
NRPERLNAISVDMLQGLSKALVELDQDRSVRVIVLTGAGRGFCAGLDLQDAAAGTGIGGGGGMAATLDLRDAPPTVLHGIDTPTVCALNGGAAGYGMDLALGCDIRVAAESGKLAAAFTRRGVLPESGGTWLLPRLVGWAKAAEIIFTGRTLSAEQCLELGLVNQVVPDDLLMKETLALAEEIASNAPLAVQASKRMMRMGLAEQFDDHVHHVFLQLLPLFGSQDFREGMASFLEKREPKFQGK